MSIDSRSEREFPKFIKYLKELFGNRISTSNYHIWPWGGNMKRCFLVLDGNSVGSMQMVYSGDDKEIISKSAWIKTENLPVKTDDVLVSLEYVVKKEQKEHKMKDYKIPFP